MFYEKDINCKYVGRHLAAILEFRQLKNLPKVARVATKLESF